MIIEDLRELLHQRHDRPRDKDSLDIDDKYGSESWYMEREPDDSPFRSLWIQFQHEIRSRSRFFSVGVENLLGRIFEDLSAHEAFDDRPMIREIGPDDEDGIVWRARIAESREQLNTILQSPTQEIGPPGPQWEAGRIRPPGGRMNAPGIPVFYGARDRDTCVAEVRPPVGSYVVAAKFEVLRPLRLLDLEALEKIYVKDSYFHPEFTERRSKALFLQWLAREIGRPIMPHEEATEYLATQAMAEYLANRLEPRLDGIIYQSAQTSGIGHNLVLFTHARGVKRSTLRPETGVSSSIAASGHLKYRDNHGDVVASESVPPNDVAASGSKGQHDDDAWSYDEPTLRLDLESVVVLPITGVKYKYSSRSFRLHRPTPGV